MPLFLVLVLVLTDIAAAEQTGGEPHGLLLRSETGLEPAPILSQLIQIKVTGIIARATVTQVFTNPTANQVEAVYVFPLPETAAVDTLRLVVGDRVIEGEIQPKEEAAETYRQAAREGRKAVLLEQQRPNVFTASVTRIGPGETVEVEIEMQFDVDYDLGTFRLRFPTVVAPRHGSATAAAPLLQPPVAASCSNGSSAASSRLVKRGPALNPTAFWVDVEAGFPIANVESSHNLRVNKQNGRFSAELVDELTSADRDFFVEWTPESGKAPRITSFVEERDGERYVLLMVVPPPPDALASVRLPREAIFVVDLSGSMDGTKLDQARQALLMGLDQLQPGDSFNVIWFATDAGALYPTSRGVDFRALAEGREFIEAFDLRGGTHMTKPLKMALGDDDPSSTRLRQVIFITDGQADNEEELFGIIQKNLGRSRLFTVGIGAAPNSHFMRRAAELGRGTFTLINDLSSVAKNMTGLLRKLDAPVVKDIRVEWDDPSVEAWPRDISDLYLGEPLVIAARMHDESGVRISGWQRGKHLDVSLPLTVAQPLTVTQAALGENEEKAGSRGVGKLWARRKIDALESERSGGGDAEEIRTRIVDLGLRHHLVTDFTSLVSVDQMPTVPAEETPRNHWMPVNPVAPSDVEETITVTSESPLLDARRITTGATIDQAELEKIPTARDPWAALQATPGTQADRINVGGHGSAPPTTLVAAGSAASENVWSVDGVVIENAESVGASPSYYNFDAFEEVQVTTGGSDVSQSRGGVRLNIVTKRGTNEWRGSGRYDHTRQSHTRQSHTRQSHTRQSHTRQSHTRQLRNRSGQSDEQGGSAAGPIIHDRLWAWASYNRLDADRTAFAGAPSSSRLEGGGAKVNVQLSAPSSLVARWNEGDASRLAVDAGPKRLLEASTDASSVAKSMSAESTYVFSSSFFLTAAASSSDRDERSMSRTMAEAWWAEDGVLRGGGRGGALRLEQQQVLVDGQFFFNTSYIHHNLFFGAERRDVQLSRDSAWPGGRDLLHIDGANFGVGGGFYRLDVPGRVKSDRGFDSLWVQDTLNWHRVMINGGLRYDHQRGRQASDVTEINWTTLAPRFSVTVALGEERQTMLRASWARFTQQLTGKLVTRSDRAAFGEGLFRFTDTNGDGLWQSGEPSALVAAEGLFRAHRIDPALEPALDDEILLGVEHAFTPNLVVSLFFTHRRQSEVHESRDLVIGEGGELRPALAGDYVLDHAATGTLPDGSPYSVPVYSLRPGIQDGGASLLVNGDRDLDYGGVTLGLQKRLRNRWMARAHVHYGERQWRLGDQWALHHDPTNLLGGGDDDGALYVETPGDIDLGTSPWIQSTWSGSASGMVSIFPDRKWGFDLAGHLQLRQGYPLPYYVWDLASRDGLPRRLQVTADVDSFRLEEILTFDLRMEKEVSLFADLKATWSLDAFNVFNQDTALRRELNLSGPRGGDLEETVASRVFRLGLRLSWN